MPRRALSVVAFTVLGCGSSPPPSPVLESRVPSPRVDAGVVDAGPSPIVGRIIAFELAGPDVILSIAKGRDDGVALRWTGVVIDGNGTAVPESTITIIRIEPRTSIGVLRGRTTPPGPDVRLLPP